jgi:4'-phosphopantetheinyl transferase
MNLVKITNSYLKDVSWINASAVDYVTSNKIDVWKINIPSHLSLLDTFRLILSPEEIAKANSFYQTKDKNRHIIGRGAIRSILEKYLNQPASLIKFKEETNKKPYLINSGKNNLFYNISYAADWILLAVANSEIGVDAELIKHNFDFRGIIYKNFSGDEVNYIINYKIPADHFFLLWTRKEALIKATGQGLNDHLKLMPVLDGTHLVQSDIISSINDWEIHSFKINDQYIASIAAVFPAGEIRFFDANLNFK